MHFKALLSQMLAAATTAMASPAVVQDNPPMITMCRKAHLEGDCLKLWSIGECATIGGTMYNDVGSVNVRAADTPSYYGMCTLYSSDDCKPGTAKYHVGEFMSPFEVEDHRIKSVFCKIGLLLPL